MKAAAKVLVCLFALPVGLLCATPSAVGTSPAAAPVPTISISDVTVAEGDSGNVTATFAVTLSAASLDIVTVDYETADGTATAPADYASRSGRVTFLVGQTRRNVNVQVHGDTLDEANETFTVDLSTPVNATIADGRGLGRIDDDDPLPALSVDDVSVAEGNSGTVNATFTVSLSPVSGRAVSVDFATTDDTAIAPADYLARSGSLTFPAGQTTRQVTVPVNGDILDEANESFTLDLSGASHATLADGQGVGTINDDDPLPTLSLADVGVVEGNSGSVNANFTVTLSRASGRTVTVDYATANGTAMAGSDYQARSGTLTFIVGQTTLQVTVPVIGDTLDEGNETFRVNLSNPVRATIADGQATGTIIDDEGAPALTIQDATVTEGDAGTVIATVLVTLAPVSGQPVTVDYATADESATAPADYLPAGGQLSFPPGEGTRDLTVVVNGDTLDEVDEAFLVNLSGPVNATIADGQATGTIVDDDASPQVAIGDASLNEGNAGSGSATFTISLSAVSGRAVTVDYATADVTARAPDDYVAIPPTTLTFAAGETSRSVTVAVVGEEFYEPDETFAVSLSNAAGATIADGQGLGSIVNDDAVPPPPPPPPPPPALPPPPPPPPPPQKQAVRSALVQPPAGAQLGAAPLLVWRPVAKARFYNVQLYRREQKILSIWPNRPRVKLRPAWTYRGRSFRLRPGAYTWIVWPAFGPPDKARFGGKLGQSTFRMVRTARA